jgi:DNA polymerase I
MQYRSMSKLKSTYTDRLPEQINPRTGRIHTSYHQAVAATGRLSSSDPNLQNIPIRTAEGRRIRQAFVAPKGYKLLAADYSQIELRIMAHLAKDEGLLNAFRTTWTCTRPRRPKCSASSWRSRPAISAAAPRRSTSA